MRRGFLRMFALCAAAFVIAVGCEFFTGTHDVRLRCRMSVGTLAHVTVGTASYGDVACDGTKTDYETVVGGLDHKVSTAGTLLGHVNVIGQGRAKWTVTVAGSLALPALFIVQDVAAE